MTLRFYLSVLLFGICGLTHVLGFPLQEVDDITSWEEDEQGRQKRLWRNWDTEDEIKRAWLSENLANSLYKRLWRWPSDVQMSGEREVNVKRLWRSQENNSEGESLCVTCAESRCKRSSNKMRPNGGKTLPCCNC